MSILTLLSLMIVGGMNFSLLPGSNAMSRPLMVFPSVLIQALSSVTAKYVIFFVAFLRGDAFGVVIEAPPNWPEPEMLLLVVLI